MPTHQPPRTNILKFICGFVVGVVISSVLLHGCMDAAVREGEARNQMRADRCARETAPAGYTQTDWDKYCEGTGQ